MAFAGEPRHCQNCCAGVSGGAGEITDLPILKAEFERGNYQTKGPAVDAIIRVNMRQSREAARATALKVIKALSKSRLRKLLRLYTEHDKKRFYNVIYWLDLGISLPKTRVLHAVQISYRKRR
jgi:hypothetical protein